MTTAVERWTMRGLSPIGRTINHAVGSSLIGTSRTDGASSSTVAELQRQITELQVENVSLRSERAALQESGAQQKALTERKLHGIQAHLIARSPDPSTSYVVIDRGAHDGVHQGDPIIIRDGIIIGKVISTTDDTSRVLLSTDNRSSIAGYDVVRATAQGVISGVQGLTMTMELIPQSETIELRDIIVTSGLDPSIPRGLIIGEIERIDRQQGALFQSATLHTPYLNAELDIVTVILASPS